MTLLPRLVGGDWQPAGPVLDVAYDPVLVAISFLLAALAAFVTLRLVGHLRTTGAAGRRRRLVPLAAVTLGGGIWSMHFTGMLAASLPVEVSYDAALTLVSLLVPVLICGVGVFWMRVATISVRRLAASGIVTGLGIVVMHYLGMAAMRAPVDMVYRAGGFAGSVAVGIGAATLAFWFAKHFSDESRAEPNVPVALGTSAIMAGAIAGMHYLGMAATVFVDVPHSPATDAFALDPHLMATAIAATLLVVLCAAQLTIAIEEGTAGRARLATLPLLMATVALGAGGTAVAVLYDTALRFERRELLEVARVQRELIEAVARFDAQYSAGDVTGGAAGATLAQVREAHRNFAGFGDTGEFYLARVGEAGFDYVVPLRFANEDRDAGTAGGRGPDRPMRLALAGLSGTTIGPDYRGERVLAAHTPVPALGLGLVVKLDMHEIRAPFVRAALVAAGVTLALIAAGIGVSRRISSPVVVELDEKARLEVELEFARAVQQGLLPDAPPSLEGVELAAATLPARFVSGDFYDFITLGERRVAMVIGDVSGKGVSAALLMARLLSDVRHAFARTDDPAEVLATVNDSLVANARQGMFATACCLCVDTSTARLELASAGHLPLAHRSGSGRVTAIGRPSGPPLGVLAGSRYTSESHALSPGDAVVGYTDGVVEPRDADGTEFGEARLRQLIASYDGLPAHFIEHLHATLAAFSRGLVQHDDLTVLVLRATRS